jgi:hypothetical protein
MTRESERARAALASEPRLDLHKFPIELSYADGTLTLEGEVGDIAAKKLALERAAALPEVTGIIDRLRVRPAQRMGDGQIRDLVRDALLQEPALAEFAVSEPTAAARGRTGRRRNRDLIRARRWADDPGAARSGTDAPRHGADARAATAA